MQSETLPVPTQPDEPSDVTPCHTGAAAKVCGYCATFGEEVAAQVLTCGFCGVPHGQKHKPTCEFPPAGGA